MSRELTIQDVDEIITNVSNCIFGNIKTKKTVQDMLAKIIIKSCITYQHNPIFRDNINRWRNSYYE